MQKNHFIYITISLFILIATWGCKGKTTPTEMSIEDNPASDIVIKGDSMIYGLSCDGTSDSVVVIWPFSGGDPVTYNCIEAKQAHKIIGKPEIGDWIGVMPNPEDPSEATMVIALDQLKGTWTYPVMPVMKDLQHMSRRMQKRMMENMPDSVKQTFFIPREYGFTLKRGHVAQPVGRIMRKNTLEDDSPVQYPEVRNYKGWYLCNGRLLLVSGENNLLNIGNKSKKTPDVIDTLDFVEMTTDSLILKHNGTRYGFHRKENAMKANESAQNAENKK